MIEQRRRLGAFLRTRRERLTPAEAGLHGGHPRRRTPGLRREEVALLCGLSPTWYTWLEQGRRINASADVLRAIGRALRKAPSSHISGGSRVWCSANDGMRIRIWPTCSTTAGSSSE